MAKKPDLTPVSNLTNNSAATAINTNYDKIEAAFENTLSRDGSTPNQMEVDIDMNGFDLLNVGGIELPSLILTSPNNTKWKIVVDDLGAISAVMVE